MPRAQVGGMDDVAGPEQWLMSLPIVTRYWFGITCFLTLSANFQIYSPMWLIWDFTRIKENFEVWRAVTAFCYAGKFDFMTLISIFMLVTFSRQYEAGGPYNTGAGGGTADYVFCLMFGMVSCLLTYPLLEDTFGLSPILLRTLVFYVLYIWSRRNPTAPANIWGIPMKAMYLPFAYLAMTIFMGNPFADLLHGIALGHVYYFLADIYPSVQGKDILRTPAFLINYFGIGEYVPPNPAQGMGNNTWNPPRGGGGGGGGGGGPAGGRRMGGIGQQPPQQQQQQQPQGHRWGTGGRVLGTQ